MENNYQMNPVSLRFYSKEQESKFLSHYFNLTLWQMRAALGLAFILYSLFAILDIWIVPDVKEIIWSIRASVCTCYLLFFAYSFTSFFRRYSQVSIAVISFIASFGIVLMISIADNLGNYLYFVGVILVINWTYVFSSLRFANATITCFLVIVIYEIVAIGIKGNPIHILVNNSFFMVSGNVIAMFAGYMMEMHKRNSFVKNQVISSRTAAIKELMDNTGQGFLSFSSDFRIHNEYSKACLAFFSKSIENLDVTDLLFPEKKQEIKELLQLVFAKTSGIELVSDMLPKEVRLNDQVIAISYIWIESNNDHSQDKFMCILTDITQEQRLKELLKADEERNQLVLKVALDREGFIQFLQSINTLFERLFSLFEQDNDTIDPGELFRCYHTIKGGAASFGLKKVATEAHLIESELSEYRKSQQQFTQEMIESMANRSRQLKQILNDSLHELSDIISTEELHSALKKYYKVSENKITALESILEQAINDIKKEDLLNAIEALRRQPIGPILKKYANDAEQLAAELDKQVKVELEGTDIEISHDHFADLFSVLIHLVRNSVDHGIETADIRSMLGKPEAGTLTIAALKDEQWIKLLIKDDGGGIDEEAVSNIAVAKGIITEEQASRLTSSEVVKLIFQPGFSTKEQVSDISGRGVGMDAVSAAVEELKGSIDIVTQLDQGTTFEIKVPAV